MSHIASERNKTIVIPVPIEVVRKVLRKFRGHTKSVAWFTFIYQPLLYIIKLEHRYFFLFSFIVE
jgi:hypothetical protein